MTVTEPTSALVSPPTAGTTVRPSRGGTLDLDAVEQQAGGRRLLGPISLTVRPGELLAVAGPSGSGKTTLLEVLAGLRRPSAGAVRHDDRPIDLRAAGIGFVPQDDIIHRELPLRRTLRYAARLRLPSGTSPDVADRIVDETLADLDLCGHEDVAVGDLSGGQRKRASIAVELLTRPDVLVLDEPTSGLDPATAAEVMAVLRRLSARGATVVVTTHAPADLGSCDRVVFLAPGGRMVYDGPPGDAVTQFGARDLADVYRFLSDAAVPPVAPAPTSAPSRPVPSTADGASVATAPAPRPAAGWCSQWWLLTRRNVEVLVRNRLTLAVLLGSPALVIAMMATLFRADGFERAEAGSLGATQTVFWIAFAGFFFGLTYGLLQIVTERAVLRREHATGVHIGAYVASKVAVLVPVLVGVDVVLLVVLRSLDRLPAAGWDVYGPLAVTLLLESCCALALGLLASALVADPAQATLALPMLCFPQVLFAGAVVPVAEMATGGRAMSVAMANRWAFESLGRSLDLGAVGSTDVAAGYGDAFAGSPVAGWLVLAGSATVLAVATVAVLRRRLRTR